MEAAIRTAYWMLTDENPKADLVKLTPVRGMDGIREAELEINGIPVRAAVVHGTENARQLMEKIKAKAVNYDFVEVMTCRGGCIGGGGQPKSAVPVSYTHLIKKYSCSKPTMAVTRLISLSLKALTMRVASLFKASKDFNSGAFLSNVSPL